MNEYSVLDGFVISNGRADGLSSTDDDKGGAIYIRSRGGFKFQNCEFVNNFGENGGAINIESLFTIDSLKISNVIFTNNEGISGGGIYTSGGTTTIDSCDLSFNLATNSGGAIRHQFGKLAISNSNFNGNSIFFDQSVSTDGGAISLRGEFDIDNCSFSSNGTDTLAIDGGALAYFNRSGSITNSTFINNVAKDNAGAIYGVGGDVLIDRCYFEKNRTGLSSQGGAILMKGNNTNRINNCIFFDNKTALNGGAISNGSDSNAAISNCTFYKNGSSGPGGAIFNIPDDSLSIVNCIFWDNSFPSGSEISGTTFDVLTNCIIQGGLNQGPNTLVGTNILDVNPQFIDTIEASLNLSLQSCSPAIDAGDNIYVSSKFDYDQNPRFHNATGINFPMVDLGAYEFQGGFDPGCSDCPQHLVLTGDIHSGVYEASSSVICNGTIVDGSSVMFSAPDSVVMQPNFDAGINTDLTILQDSCED